MTQGYDLIQRYLLQEKPKEVSNDKYTGLYDVVPTSRLRRFKCSACSFTDRSRELVAVHSSACTATVAPRDNKIHQQAMCIYIQREPSILKNVPEAYLLSKLDPASFEWVAGDATLPDGWKVAEWRTGQIFLSPTGFPSYTFCNATMLI